MMEGNEWCIGAGKVLIPSDLYQYSFTLIILLVIFVFLLISYVLLYSIILVSVILLCIYSHIAQVVVSDHIMYVHECNLLINVISIHSPLGVFGVKLKAMARAVFFCDNIGPITTIDLVTK